MPGGTIETAGNTWDTSVANDGDEGDRDDELGEGGHGRAPSPMSMVEPAILSQRCHCAARHSEIVPIIPAMMTSWAEFTSWGSTSTTRPGFHWRGSYQVTREQARQPTAVLREDVPLSTELSFQRCRWAGGPVRPRTAYAAFPGSTSVATKMMTDTTKSVAIPAIPRRTTSASRGCRTCQGRFAADLPGHRSVSRCRGGRYRHWLVLLSALRSRPTGSSIAHTVAVGLAPRWPASITHTVFVSCAVTHTRSSATRTAPLPAGGP